MTLLSIILLALSIVAYAISQLAAQGKLEWSKRDDDFFGPDGWKRKYKQPLQPAKGLYYRIFGITYKERFPGSASVLVMFTDMYHLGQALFFVFVSLSFIPHGWWIVITVWLVIHAVNFITRKVFGR